MSNLKYVVINNGGLAGETMFVFPSYMNHADVAQRLGDAVSAGFIGRNDGTRSGFYVYGESVSLKMKARDEDQVLLDILFKKD